MSIRIENVVTPSPEQWRITILGARNAMNSWDRSDSEIKYESPHDMSGGEFVIGPNDHDLLMRLVKAGTDHRKFLRMLPVYADIVAPLYFWKEFDTYKVGTVANSCSTMHKIQAKEFTLDDFSHEHLEQKWFEILDDIIDLLNEVRMAFVKTKEKRYWWQMIQLLPSSYNQKRTVMLNYEVLRNMYFARKDHKLDEWIAFCDWAEKLSSFKEIFLEV